MSVTQHADGCSDRGSSMRLPLHSTGGHGGNAFPISSSSSSSSSTSSCFGQSSPESQRSLSSLSGHWTDSPLDCDTPDAKNHDVVLSKWPPKDEPLTETVTAQPEYSSNSVSVYLDANSSEYQDLWSDSESLSLNTHSSIPGLNEDPSSASASETPDTVTTEIPPTSYNNDDEEDDLFLSVSSDMGLRRNSHRGEIQAAETVGLVEVCEEPPPPASEDLSETNQDSPESKDITSPPAEELKPPTRSKPTTAETVAVRPQSLEAKRVSRVDTKNEKAAVGSLQRKTPSQVLYCQKVVEDILKFNTQVQINLRR